MNQILSTWGHKELLKNRVYPALRVCYTENTGKPSALYNEGKKEFLEAFGKNDFFVSEKVSFVPCLQEMVKPFVKGKEPPS